MKRAVSSAARVAPAALALLASLALGACAAPSSYDGLSGGAQGTVLENDVSEGAKEDPALAAPRPLSPLSVSLVSSKRPRLRWDLARSGLSGAIVEMSRTRDFANDVKRFAAPGAELVVPEDLELGVWFWRLLGTSGSSIGTKPSVVWEMVVRGPALRGASDAPSRAMVDMNGDGEPDLLIAASVDDLGPADPAGGLAPALAGLFTYTGNREHALAPNGAPLLYETDPYEGPIAISAGADFDGDGYSDAIESGMSTPVMKSDNRQLFDVNVWFGSGQENAPLDSGRSGLLDIIATPTALASVHEAGDVDGDGYGDAVVGINGLSFLVLGVTSHGRTPVVPLLGVGADEPTRAVLGGFDANGDGLGDLAFSYADRHDPLKRAVFIPGDRARHLGEPVPVEASDTRNAVAFTAGDFDGDGLDDVAITSTVDTTTRICLWLGDRAKLLRQGPCVAAAGGDKDFGLSLTAADLEGDGVDELLATARAGDVEGVRLVRLGSDGVLGASVIGVPGVGVRLTTLWPGRPGKARWAAVAADGSRVGIFEGTELRASLTPPPEVIRGFGRGLR